MAVWIWIAVISISLAFEFATLQGVAVWTAVASIGPLVLAVCKVGYVWQIVAFLVLDLFFVLCVRRYVRTLFHRIRDAKSHSRRAKSGEHK